MSPWKTEAGLTWRELAPFGIEIDRDLSLPLEPESAERFAALFRAHGLIRARGQTLNREQQTALLALLGPILIRGGENGYISSNGEANASTAELTYHADAAYTAHPFHALSLHAVDVVDGASSTRFVSAERAFDTLPAPLRARLDAHSVEMISPAFETLASRSCDIAEHKPMHRENRPSILVNPRTGRSCIGVSEMHAARLVGMDWAESRDVLHAVFDHLYAPENLYEHVWRMGDLVIWDNLTYQHARGSVRHAGRRVLQRVLVGTEGVAPHAKQA